jgi:hypothetical protein
MQVDKTGSHDEPFHVNRVPGGGYPLGDRNDATGSDADRADGVEIRLGIEDASAHEDDVEGSRPLCWHIRKR